VGDPQHQGACRVARPTTLDSRPPPQPNTAENR